MVALICLERIGWTSQSEKVDFNRDILPILSENCFYCHGPDANHREGDLRLDDRSAAIRSNAIVPENSSESELVIRIRSLDDSVKMPPPDSNRKLKDHQVLLLEKWIQEGALYDVHWAFAPLAKPIPPAVTNAPVNAKVRNPIDTFIVNRFQDTGLRQNPEATTAKLLRRLTMDLTGIPPTLAELEAFEQLQSDEAYSAAVERLLASSRFGERMVWEWLDAARYADTNGYQGDPTRAMWYWRDWSINAFNSNMPFDQFTREQLAGDLLPSPTRNQLIATGFHRNHMINGEGGRIAEESRVEYVQDRVETTGTVWLGLTLTCCRCHDHKYDPFSQREYYQLAAQFNSIDESGGNDAGGLAQPILRMPTTDQSERELALLQSDKELANRLSELETEISNSLSSPEWSWPIKERENLWSTPEWEEIRTESARELTRHPWGLRLEGDTPESERFQLAFRSDRDIRTLRLTALPQPDLPQSGPGAAENGNFVLSEVRVFAGDLPVAVRSATANFHQEGWKEDSAIDGNPKTGWGIAPHSGEEAELIVALRRTIPAGTPVILELDFLYGKRHVWIAFQVQLSSLDARVLVPPDENLTAILNKQAIDRTEADAKQIREFLFRRDSNWWVMHDEREVIKKELEELDRTIAKTMVMRERQESRPNHILVKGAYNVLGDAVQPGSLNTLIPNFGPVRNRLELANWILDDRNPLTARVIVNRLWQQLFGVGLVKTVDDFGIQGDRPSHPELLDWLACELRDSGWNIKHVIRLMVTSHTYRQSAQCNPEGLEIDPENKWLSRASRYRWPSWMLRDQALACAGLLSERVGGPPSKGYQPEGLWEEATFGQIRFVQDHGEPLYRRSLYSFWRRIVSPPNFFDVANRQNCSVRASRTNTPLHALISLNETSFLEASRVLAWNLLRRNQDVDDGERLTQLFRMCTSRFPSKWEQERLLPAVINWESEFRKAHNATSQLQSIGEFSCEVEEMPRLAAWTLLTNLVLNLDEVLCKE